MQALRKVASSSSKKFFANKALCGAPSRGFSVNLSDRERGEEARYFRQQEDLKKAEMKAQLEKILADSNHEQNDELMDILAAAKEPEEKKGLIARFRLNDWKVALPLGVLAGIPLIEQEIIMLNEELYVAFGFFAFVAGSYHFGGDAVAKFLDDYKNEVSKKLKETEEGILYQINADIGANKALLQLESEIKEVHELVDNLATVQAEALNNEAKHHFRDVMVKKLDSLVSLEESATSAIRSRMLKSVQDDVLNTFKNDKKVKEAAMNQAVAVLLGGANAKLGEDVVGKVFASSVKHYREQYAKKAPGSDEIINKLEKDIAAVLAVPSATAGEGGNVFETHPVAPAFLA